MLYIFLEKESRAYFAKNFDRTKLIIASEKPFRIDNEDSILSQLKCTMISRADFRLMPNVDTKNLYISALGESPLGNYFEKDYLGATNPRLYFNENICVEDDRGFNIDEDKGDFTIHFPDESDQFIDNSNELNMNGLQFNSDFNHSINEIQSENDSPIVNFRRHKFSAFDND